MVPQWSVVLQAVELTLLTGLRHQCLDKDSLAALATVRQTLILPPEAVVPVKLVVTV
jgi:hypothetical protein